MQKFSVWKIAGIVCALCAATAIASSAQTFTTLYNFCAQTGCPDGSYPVAGLVQATDGNFYGTTRNGGAGSDCQSVDGCGTVFKITPGGVLTTLHSFDLADGAWPYGGLVQATDGNFYGTTDIGAASSNCQFVDGCGTVFKITPGGTLTTLYDFCAQTGCTDGAYPGAGLVQGADGNFYGTTEYGGASSNCTDGCGTVFKITPGGVLTTLYNFDSTHGAYPVAMLVQGSDGNFYGTTDFGGARTKKCSAGCGTVFKITPGGVLTTLHRFDWTDGANLPAGLVQGTDGNFYGTAWGGGGHTYGTVFKVTPGGTLTTLYDFCAQTGCTDGAYPGAGLVQGADGNFYGTTGNGGAGSNCQSDYGCGTVFKITPAGTLTTLHSFDLADGAWPYGGLVQATDGNFYGTTDIGAASSSICRVSWYYGCGTVYSLSVGLGPFVETEPTSGIVGTPVTILGTDLIGTTHVRFFREATFTVVSSSEITTTVPAGATTGSVTVVTPEGTLKSNVVFRVTPQITSFKPTSGPVGTVVTITGVSLKQTEKVTFGGVEATQFTVISDTEVQATVPTGAKSGHIAITTPGGTVRSSGSFRVT